MRYAKYHFAGFFYACLTRIHRIIVEEHNFNSQQLFFNLCVIIIYSHPSFLKMNKTAYNRRTFHFVADIFVFVFLGGADLGV